MDQLVVLYDSCILYPFYLRDFFMHLALTDLVQAKWTAHIHEEWMRNVLIDKPHLKKEQLQIVRQLMDENTRDCLVTAYEPLIEKIILPDLNDRHVLAAAIKASASIIITYNLKDFPSTETEKYGVEAQHPDEFISQLLDIAPGIICGAIRRLRGNYKTPPVEADTYLEILARQALPNTASKLKEYVELI